MDCRTADGGQRTAGPFKGLLSAVCCLLSACANTPETRELAPRTVELRGELAASRTATLLAPFDATVKHVAAREGAQVHAGDLLVELSNAEVEHDLAVARAQREWAQQKRGANPATAHAAAIADRKKAKRDRYRALYATHDVTLQELEDAEVEYSAALRDLGNMTPPRASAIELERAVADEKLAQQRQEALALHAPIDGVVTRLQAAEGRDVSNREPLAEITAMGNLEARAEVDPDLLRVIRPGMNAEVRIMTIPPKVILDKISYIVPFRADRKAAVIVNIANNDASLQPGTPVVLTIKTQ